MSTVKTKLAAAATLVGLGGLAGWAVSQPADQGKAAAAQAAAPVEVRTQVVRRTVHIVRHEKPTHRRKSAAATAGAGGAARRWRGQRVGSIGGLFRLGGRRARDPVQRRRFLRAGVLARPVATRDADQRLERLGRLGRRKPSRRRARGRRRTQGRGR